MSSLKLTGFFIFTMVCCSSLVYAQEESRDSLPSQMELSEFVVTATRSSRKLSDVPIPVTLIGKEQIQSSGASRLDEILAEQTGLTLVSDHGVGIQMQGMGSEYCLILINGEPAIGRTAGTFDLTRISLSNVKRIEIIKGPSSSLYGSDALGGVINIITDNSKRNGIHLQTKYGKYHSFDNTITGSLRLNNRGSVTLSGNRFHSGGYDLSPETYGKTVDPYTSYTFRGKLNYQVTPKLKASLSGHYFSEKQNNNYITEEEKDTSVIKGTGKEKDGSVNATFSYDFSPNWHLKLRNYWSQFKTKSELFKTENNATYENSHFTQTLWKEELQSKNVLNTKQVLSSGIGFSRESVVASRYTQKEELSDYYLYLQHEWHPTTNWNILTGLRYDYPSSYHAQLSPKIAAQYKLDDHWKFQASFGTGYKAPALRQLFLTFSNSVVGYSVLGTKVASRELENMKQAGMIQQVYIDPSKMDDGLKPESSAAYNLGGSYTGDSDWKVSVNFFRNDIKNLIDTRIIARKTNGQPLYSYYNVHRVYTEGAELNGQFSLLQHKLTLRAGYQFLIAKDKNVVAQIKDGLVINDPKTGPRYAELSDYGGLFNRSKHSFNVKAYYHYHSWAINARMTYRSRFGFADMNGDNILDADKEYVSGYALVHLNAEKSFLNNKMTIRAGVKNLFNYTDPQHLSYEPGRFGYIGASFHLYK